MDFIGFGHIGLVQAMKKLDYEKWKESEDLEKTIKSFLSKRIKGAIRRNIDKNRGSMSPNNDGRNVFLWMVFMGFIFVSLVVLERVMEVPQI